MRAIPARLRSEAAAHECVEGERAALAGAAKRLGAVQQPAGKNVEVAGLRLEADDRSRELLAAEKPGLSYRLIGAGLTEFVDAETAGSDMFADDERRTLRNETAIDALRGKFGAAAVVSGRALKSR